MEASSDRFRDLDSPPRHKTSVMNSNDGMGDSAQDNQVVPPPLPPGFQNQVVQIDSAEAKRSRRKLRLFCFHCNRPEGHSIPYLGAWFYSYFIGLTFGLIHFIGPFRCQCCGKQRLMFRDWLHPKFHAVVARHRAAAPTRRSR
jgi:hypothetical protein